MVSLNCIVAFFKRKSKTQSSSLKVWVLYILVSAASARWLYYSQSWSWSLNPRGSPVLLTHGNDSARVGTVEYEVSMLDVVKSCPSLHGEGARYRAPWWMFSCVYFDS